MATELAPDINTECPEETPADLIHRIEESLLERFEEHLTAANELQVISRVGKQAAYLRCQIGPKNRTHDFHFFTRDVPGIELDGALGVVLDFADGALEQFFEADRDAYFPLDYTGHPFGDGFTVYARSQLRDFVAEEATVAFLREHGELGLLDEEV